MTHANHQGEPGDTGAGDDRHEPVAILYTNWRGETAVRQIVPSASADAIGFRSSEWHPASQWCLLALDAEKVKYRDFALSGIKAWGDEAVAKALASAPSPKAGAGEDLDRIPEAYRAKVAQVLAFTDEDWIRLRAYFPEEIERFRRVLSDRSGKLVASTGSGEETKGACLTGYAEFTPISVRSSTGAPASPSGHSRAEPSGLGAPPECPSRGPSAPGVLWSAWSETDADSDPSDPGVTYCTEWFVGRWPIGAEEPDCRILIGTSRSAEIIARRVAEKLTSTLNTDRIRLGASGWRADCFRTRMNEFDAAYKKARASSQPQDWMDAALLAQQFRNVAYAVLIGEAPRQEPPAYSGSLGEARCNSFYEAYEAVRKLAPSDNPSTTESDR